MVRRVWGAGLLLAAAVAGCGRGDTPPVVTVFEVKGRVLLKDRKPLAGGHVYFVPTSAPWLLASAPVGPDGRFALATGDSGAGAPPGDYKVRVEPDGPPPLVGAGRRPGTRLPFPPRYLDEDSSGLRVTVKAEPNTLESFVLK
jgi:hypothetical protein